MNITSGSVIAPVLVSTLLEQGKLVVAIGVVTQDSKIELTNSIATLKSYEAISAKLDKPVVLSVQKNSDSDTHEKINNAVGSTIVMLAILASRKNVGLDSADLRNWLNYDRVTTAPVKAVTLDISSGNDVTFEEHIQPISTATLARAGTPTKPSWIPDYQCVGYVPVEAEKNAGLEKPLHFTIVDGSLAEIFQDLDADKQALVRKAQARTYATGLLSGSEDVEGDGLVFE